MEINLLCTEMLIAKAKTDCEHIIDRFCANNCWKGDPTCTKHFACESLKSNQNNNY